MNAYDRSALRALVTVLGMAACVVSSSCSSTQPSAGAKKPLAGETGGPPAKLLQISAFMDGSGRFVFARDDVRYEHKHWGRPENVMFDGKPWDDLSQTPPAWRDCNGRLDLTRARIVEREGRDIIALEQTADGFDLYLCDSPNGSAPYSVTIAIPQLERKSQKPNPRGDPPAHQTNYAIPEKVTPLTAQQLATKVPRSYYFEYNAQPEPGKRYW